jgi:hypothetical protein
VPDMGYLCENCLRWVPTLAEAEEHSDAFAHSLGPCPRHNAPDQEYDPDLVLSFLRRGGVDPQVAMDAEATIATACGALALAGKPDQAAELHEVLNVIARTEAHRAH